MNLNLTSQTDLATGSTGGIGQAITMALAAEEASRKHRKKVKTAISFLRLLRLFAANSVEFSAPPRLCVRSPRISRTNADWTPPRPPIILTGSPKTGGPHAARRDSSQRILSQFHAWRNVCLAV